MYIDAALINKKIFVSERTKEGVRSVKSVSPPYVFYHEDREGSYTSIYGDQLKRRRFNDRRAFQNALEEKKNKGLRIFESDIPPVFRYLEEKYPSNDTPPLHISIIDIEVNTIPEKGWPRPDNPYGEITAVTINNKWENAYYTLMVPPEGMTKEELKALWEDADHEDGFGALTEDNGYFICENEEELLLTMLNLLEDSDVITGWNSEFYDLPYIIIRIRIVLGGELLENIVMEDGSEEFPFDPNEKSTEYLMMLNLFPSLPGMRMTEHFGKEEKTFTLSGRIHLDYMALYIKFTQETLHSYNLDFILQREVNQTKVYYDGSLADLYVDRPRTYAVYSRQDVQGLSHVDDKRKMIDLANSMAHMASVTLDKVTGSVVIIEQAILKQLHKNRIICFDKQEIISDSPIPGGYVVEPEGGRFEWIASYDFNSLYPSIIRLINISPEVVVGQFKLDKTEYEFFKHVQEYAKGSSNEKVIAKAASKAWTHFTGTLEYHDIIEENDNIISLKLENQDEEIAMSAKEWKEILTENNWSVSANGTVFDNSRYGIVPECLTIWYNERVQFKNLAKEMNKKAESANNKEDKEKYTQLEKYYDMIQLAKKLFLNSTYGAFLNRFFRFYDPRLGASVTLSGRVTTKTMIANLHDILDGDRKTNSVIYGDTDSAYITLKHFMKHNDVDLNEENAIATADIVGDLLNDNLAGIVPGLFLIPEDRANILEAGRESVAVRGLFKDKKKKYALYVIDSEGKKPEKPLKIVGLETRRTDTPKFIQEFLEKCINLVVVENHGFHDLSKFVEEYREDFRKIDIWKRGSPCRVSNLTIGNEKISKYDDNEEAGYIGMEKPRIHYAVPAAINTNDLMKLNSEQRWDFIRDGDKVEVLYLLDNPYKYRSVAIRSGEQHIPEWFKTLPFDNDRHEKKLIDQKLGNIFGILGWEFEANDNFVNDIFEEEDFFGSVSK